MTSSSHSPAWVDRNDLLNRVDLAALLNSLTDATGTGHRRRWRCPVPSHLDTNPSVSTSHDRNGHARWRCWSGGHGGTAIDAVIAARGLQVGEAIRWLNEHHAHLEPVRSGKRNRPTTPDTAAASKHISDYVDSCAELLWTPAGTRIRAWLHRRGLSNDVLRANRVGADPGDEPIVKRSGIPRGHAAAVFPVHDPNGRLTYFQARLLDPERSGRKYANPTRALATNPKLAWTVAGDNTRKKLLVVTEGIPDSLVVANVGVAAVAVLGSAIQGRMIAPLIAKETRSDTRVEVCFDADTAGRTAAADLLHQLSEQGVAAKNIEPPDGLDLTDWSINDDAWAQHLGPERRRRSVHSVANEREVEEVGLDL